MKQFKELSVKEMQMTTGGGHGKPIYFKDLTAQQQRCIVLPALTGIFGGPGAAALTAAGACWPG